MFMNIDFGERTWEVWPLSVIAFATTAFILYRKRYSFSYIFFLSMFWIYLTFAIDAIFFPIAISGAFVEESRQFCPLPKVNLVPLYFGPYADFKRVFISSVQNIILTIPFGFGISFVVSQKTRRIVIMSILIGVIFETVQYGLSRILGYCYRVVDVNDVIFNAAGVLFGYGFFRVFVRCYTVLTNRLDIEHRGIMKYMYDVCMGKQNPKNATYAK